MSACLYRVFSNLSVNNFLGLPKNVTRKKFEKQKHMSACLYRVFSNLSVNNFLGLSKNVTRKKFEKQKDQKELTQSIILM
jgi:hypothetical protein